MNDMPRNDIMTKPHHIMTKPHHVMVKPHHIMPKPQYVMVKPHHVMMKPHHIMVNPHHVITNDHIRKLWLSIVSNHRMFKFEAAIGHPQNHNQELCCRYNKINDKYDQIRLTRETKKLTVKS